MDNKDTGLLLSETNLKLQRRYFTEMTRLKGINVIYRAPRKDKHYNGYGELMSFYQDPEVVGCIYQEHLSQWTMRKLGWDAELSDDNAVIHVPYDLHDLQKGALFIVPSAIDMAKGRVFRVERMSTTTMFPASIACEIAPVLDSTFQRDSLHHDTNNFSLLPEEGED